MIIIAENKKNHYLIKDFINDVLKENNEYDGIFHPKIPDRDQADTVLDTPVYNDDDITVLDTPVYNDDDIIEDEKVLDKIIKKQPKFSGIKSLAKKGLITLGIAAALWSAAKNNIDISDSATGLKISVSIENQAKKAGVSITNDEIKHALNTSVNNKQITTGNTELSTSNESQPKENKKASKNKSSREEIKKLSSERIKAFESYRPYPYQDVEGISIGYGTQFINKGRVESLQDDWKEIIYKKIGLSEKEIKEKEKNEEYKESVDKELNQYILEIDEKIENLINKKNKIVNPYKGKKPKNWKPRYHFPKKFRNKLQKVIDNLKIRKNVVNKRGVLTEDEAEACFDIDIENRLDNLESNFKNPYIMDSEINDVLIDMYYNIGSTSSKFPDFTKHIKEYHKEMSEKLPDANKIKVILEKADHEISPEGAPEYHRQNKVRAESNQELIQDAINKYDQNESLRKVYKHLFV